MPSTPLRLVLCVCATAAPLACGAGGASAGAKTADTATPAPAPPAASSAAASDTGPATTTTAVADTGDQKAIKLPEARSASPAPASVDAGTSEGHGREAGRGPADLRAMVQAHRDEARACYDKGLVDHPGMEGDLVIQWVIDPKGKVSHVTVDSTRSQITDPGVVACIGAVIGKLQFASSPGGYETRASYPFNFHPHHASHGANQ